MSDPVVSPIIVKNYGEKLSLDLDSSLPATMSGGCLSLKNVIRRNGRGLAKRPGTRMVAANTSGVAKTHVAIGKHSYFNSSNGITEELLEFMLQNTNANLSVFSAGRGTVTVAYGGAGTGSISILPNSSAAWEVTLYVNDVAVSGWPKTYSDGMRPGASLEDLAQLVADINATVNWTAAKSSEATGAQTKVASLGAVAKATLASASPLSFISTVLPSSASVGATSTIPGGSGTVGVDMLDFENIVGINADNCFYLPLGKAGAPLKYDGLRLYRPGLPRLQLSSVADTGAGATFAAGSTRIYRAVFWRVDNKNNQIYGPYSDDALAVATHTVGGAPTNITLTIKTLERSSNNANYGNSLAYNPRTGIVNGGQVGVTTITTDAGNTFEIGDTVYFLDRATSTYVTRVLTGRTSTTITFAGAVDVNDNDVISNIRIQIQRTENNGIDFFEVANIPHDGTQGTTTQAYIDSTADANLGDAIEEQDKLPEPPIGASFACVHQGLVVYAGLEGDPVGFAWNDPAWGREAFPSASNRDQVLGGQGGAITAIFSESDSCLAIFKQRAYFRIEGDLASGQYTITEASQNRLGVASQASIVKTEEGIFAISLEGPVLIAGGAISLIKDSGVTSLFEGLLYETPAVAGTAITSADARKLVPRRSTGCYWSAQKVILFFIPAEAGTPVSSAVGTDISRYATADSLWLCYDVVTREWREFDFANYGINAHVAMTEVNGELYFVSSNSTATVSSGAPVNHVWKFLPDSSAYNYADNVDAIEFAPRLQWQSLDSPSSEKVMTEMKLYARHATDFIASFSLTMNEYRNNDDSTKYTQASRTFSASSDKEKIVHPVDGKFESNSVELYNNTLFECPVLSGLEMSYKLIAAPEIKDIAGD